MHLTIKVIYLLFEISFLVDNVNLICLLTSDGVLGVFAISSLSETTNVSLDSTSFLDASVLGYSQEVALNDFTGTVVDTLDIVEKTVVNDEIINDTGASENTTSLLDEVNIGSSSDPHFGMNPGLKSDNKVNTNSEINEKKSQDKKPAILKEKVDLRNFRPPDDKFTPSLFTEKAACVKIDEIKKPNYIQFEDGSSNLTFSKVLETLKAKELFVSILDKLKELQNKTTQHSTDINSLICEISKKV